jgi:hypothetical protein
MVFKVDTLELPITIVIKNPEPKMFVLTGLTSADPAVRASAPTNDAITFNSSPTAAEFIKYFDNGGNISQLTAQDNDTLDLFASSTTGTFTVQMLANYATNKSGFYGRLAIADLAKGVHAFKVVKSYPDGRVETVEDRAEVTDHDSNGIAIFGVPTQLNVNNNMFKANFLINESTYVKGTYVFEFTIGSISKKYTINVVELPSLDIKSVKVGTVTTALYAGEYLLKPATGFSGDVVLDFELKNITENEFVTVSGASLIGAKFVPIAETFISLKDLTSLKIATLDSENRVNGNKMYFTLKFWTKVPFSTSSTLYRRTGEDQVVVVVFQDDIINTTTTPVMTLTAVSAVSSTGVTINYAYTQTSFVRYINQLSSLAAPTRNLVLNTGTLVDSAAAGTKTLSLTSLTPGASYTIYMVAVEGTTTTGTINTNLNIASNLVSRSYSLPNLVPTGILAEGTNADQLAADKNTVTLTLVNGTFTADVVSATRVSVQNLPAGLTATYTRTSDTVITAVISGTTSSAFTTNVANLTFTVTTAGVNLSTITANPASNLVTANITITAA